MCDSSWATALAPDQQWENPSLERGDCHRQREFVQRYRLPWKKGKNRTTSGSGVESMRMAINVRLSGKEGIARVQHSKEGYFLEMYARGSSCEKDVCSKTEHAHHKLHAVL